ncbi:MAG: hypothetical protein ACI910_002377 [Oleispira sp.]|jgi:hypothetical protein
MKNGIKTKSFINSICFVTLLLIVNAAAWSEISSLSPEELTDTYIKDTTVLVHQKKERDVIYSLPVRLKVTPLEQATQVLPEDQNHSIYAISHELSTYDDLNNQRALENNLTPQSPIAMKEFLKEPLSEELLSTVRQAYGIGATENIDISTLLFLTNLTPSNPGDIPTGISYQSNKNSFSITIPNIGNFNSQQIASPNGEIGVNVNSSSIEYILNLPK